MRAGEHPTGCIKVLRFLISRRPELTKFVLIAVASVVLARVVEAALSIRGLLVGRGVSFVQIVVAYPAVHVAARGVLSETFYPVATAGGSLVISVPFPSVVFVPKVV